MQGSKQADRWEYLTIERPADTVCSLIRERGSDAAVLSTEDAVFRVSTVLVSFDDALERSPLAPLAASTTLLSVDPVPNDTKSLATLLAPIKLDNRSAPTIGRRTLAATAVQNTRLLRAIWGGGGALGLREERSSCSDRRLQKVETNRHTKLDHNLRGCFLCFCFLRHFLLCYLLILETF